MEKLHVFVPVLGGKPYLNSIGSDASEAMTYLALEEMDEENLEHAEAVPAVLQTEPPFPADAPKVFVPVLDGKPYLNACGVDRSTVLESLSSIVDMNDDQWHSVRPVEAALLIERPERTL